MSLHNHITAFSAIHQLSEIERTIGVKKVYGPDIKRVPGTWLATPVLAEPRLASLELCNHHLLASPPC